MNSAETGTVPDIQQMADRLAIQEVLFMHCRGVDRADASTLKTTYWPEAEVAYGSYDGHAHTFCEMLAAGVTRYRATHHQVSNILVEQQDNDAVVESYVTAYHHEPGGENTEMTYFGRYVDHMQRRNGVWKIVFRCVVMDWNQNLTASSDFNGPTFSGLAKSGRAPDDPLYTMRSKVLKL